MDTSSAYHHRNMELSINTTKAYYRKKDLLNNLPVYFLGNKYLTQIFLKDLLLFLLSELTLLLYCNWSLLTTYIQPV